MNSYKVAGKNRRWPRVVLFLAILFIVASLGTIFAVRKTYVENLHPVSASQKSQLITIPEGSTVKEIGVNLEKTGVIRASWAFEWYVRNNSLRDKLQAGTYTLRPNQSTEEIANILTGGHVATDYVTILPAQRIDQIRQSLVGSGFTEQAVDKALKPVQYENHPALVDKPRGASLEGYLYPETFQKNATTLPETTIKSSLDQMQKYLTPELRAKIVSQGLTVHQGIILASIVEQEVSDAGDKKTVAQVFLKRLKENIPLQSDPTAFYGAILAGQKPTLTFKSAYNTYDNLGLPPTPISNVSAASLQAVANPSGTSYLYFVAGDDGKTYFSNTLKEHEQLTQQHCKELCN
ncbi:MAG: Endolytic murein transglycosylase [Candidatus Saccharibacteria bacterium]|nr:Endolytic murein transglycosylase [Candidatus Saccharibacteria bacterium]